MVYIFLKLHTLGGRDYQSMKDNTSHLSV